MKFFLYLIKLKIWMKTINILIQKLFHLNYFITNFKILQAFHYLFQI